MGNKFILVYHRLYVKPTQFSTIDAYLLLNWYTYGIIATKFQRKGYSRVEIRTLNSQHQPQLLEPNRNRNQRQNRNRGLPSDFDPKIFDLGNC